MYTFHSASVYSWPLKSEHLIIFEDIYQLWLGFELLIVISMRCLSQVQLIKTTKQFKVNVIISASISLVKTLTLLLIKQTNWNVYALHCTITLYIAQEEPDLSQLEGSIGRGHQWKVKWWLVDWFECYLYRKCTKA